MKQRSRIRLRTKGYEVKLQVGVSGYRIDLAVAHPDHPEHFLAGVECDGATYHSSKSARDRDRLREEVLNSLGWDLVRVWSTDWFDNPDLETAKLVRKLEALRHRERSPFESYRPSYERDESSSSLDEREVDDDQPRASVKTCTEAGVDVCEPQVNSAVDKVEAPTREPPTIGSDGLELLGGRGPITPAEASKVLEAFRETRIRPAVGEWDAERSILRPAMIETFVKNGIGDPDLWYSNVPQYLRTGTNPIEKTRFLDEICEIVGRIGLGLAPVSSAKPDNTKYANPPYPAPAGVPARLESKTTASGPTTYLMADVTSVAQPNRERFHYPEYAPTLKTMVAYVVTTEGPILESLLVDRIARAHSLQRSGNQIRRRVMGLLPRGSQVDRKGGEAVVWPAGLDPGRPFPFRQDPTGERNHEDVPLEELASLAQPFLRLRIDDEGILRRMADEFGLERLRAFARARFEAALAIARTSSRRAI